MNIFKISKRFCSYQRYNSIQDIFNHKKIGDVIEIKGWVKSLRKQKENVFIDLSDGSTDKKLQIFVPQSLIPQDLSTGSSIKSKGIVKLSPKGQLEVAADELHVYGKCNVNDGYPFAPRKTYQPEYIRQHLEFRPRTNKFGALLRVRNAATIAIYNYFQNNQYINIHTPILTSNDCEGAGEVFVVLPENKQLLKAMTKEKSQKEDEIYFDSKVFLTVSGQLHLEAAAHGLSKVYTFGPTFRAENSRSRLHLSEFYMIEAELAFLNNLNDLIIVVEDLVKSVTGTLIENCEEDIRKCSEESVPNFKWLNREFIKLTYKEACDILNNNKDKFKEEFNNISGFAKEHELFLVNHCDNTPVFITEWPKELKPFYMKEMDNDSKNVAALDLLGTGVGELVGGSLRESNYEKLKQSLSLLNNSQLNWYLNLRKFGGVPTGGFGMGFERYLQFILNISNIKDVIPFPRWPHNCKL